MASKNFKQASIIEPTSYMWHKLFLENQIPTDGKIIEVAPGYEPKIGNALALLGFKGTIFLIEPDQKTARCISKTYRETLPHATVKIVAKSLQNVEVGVDIPSGVDALVASHSFDDMVMSCIMGDQFLFSREREDGVELSISIKKLYDDIANKDYKRGIKITVKTWKSFIERLKPDYFIASQYPSYTLEKKKLIERQNSGFIVLKQLKFFYQNSLKEQLLSLLFGYKGDPKWWIVAKKPHRDLARSIIEQPLAIRRLERTIFVPQKARRLHPKEYDMVCIDNKYFRSLGWRNAISKQIQDFAIVLDNESPFSSETIITYADRQKDKTGIGLNGNHGSGRAIYYGDRFNILGVGRTTLCKSTIPSHITGDLELVGAMRRIILSRWINYFTQRAPVHPVLIALKKTVRRKWSSNPIPLALLVRVDDGCLDRPSHIEQSPKISVNFQKTLTEYARLDAEYFAHRIMLGAWSTSNYSLSGHIIDLESASFVKYRGPYYTSSAKYPHNRFGYEGLGFLRILHQLAGIKNIKNKEKEIESQFYRKRRQHLGRCFLSLLGIDNGPASIFFSKHQEYVLNLSDQFERLAKKINIQKTNLNLYAPLLDEEDPSLLDMSNLFRNLAKLYRSVNAEAKTFECIIRKTALSQIESNIVNTPANSCEAFIQSRTVVTHKKMDYFLIETKNFTHDLFKLIVLIDSKKCLNKKEDWDHRLQSMNQNLPTMFELNKTLMSLAESYRLTNISPKKLGAEINKLCELPNRHILIQHCAEF